MGETPAAESALAWRAHPARERPGATVGLLGVVAAIAAAVWIAFRDSGLVLLALAILGSSLSPWFLPTMYRLDARGASARRAGVSRARRWDEIRSVHVDRRGATLSPFANPSWLEPYRGLRLLFSANRAEVVAWLAETLKGRCPIRVTREPSEEEAKATTTRS
jgi:hypothetical protein